MSTRSDPSMVVSDYTVSIEKQGDSPMLNKWLADPPTITEKLSSPRPPKETSSVGEKIGTSREYIQEWQVSWEKKG
ncbi:hypothetical protein CJF30_00010062 [Rutstroemia sp. NJR-2017a BBW]|nr:hypothetical protein CJF30_00010062 [Rutstroemia sp. NJR-2017a BBW]